MPLSRQKKRVMLSVAIAAIVAAVPLAINVINKVPAQAAVSCECTGYVANRFNLPRDYPHAGDWNDGYLQRNGFTQTSPKPGAIVVMERSFPGSDASHGHVGIVESVAPDGRITVRGANQSLGSTPFTEADCNNVRLTPFATSVNGRSDVTFWERGATPPPTSGLRTYFVDGNFALNTNNRFSRIDGFPRMSSWQRNDSDPDQQFERLRGTTGTLLEFLHN